MVTLLIGMLLAFILGAMTVILTLAVTNPNRVSIKQPQGNPVTSKASATIPDVKTPEQEAYEKAQAAYLEQIANMIAYDGKPQGDAK